MKEIIKEILDEDDFNELILNQKLDLLFKAWIFYNNNEDI